MIGRWLKVINYAFAAVIAGLFVGALVLFIAKPTPEMPETTTTQQFELPKNAFRQPEASYKAIESPALSLSFSPHNAQLPDLRKFLTYYGKNARPDAQDEKQPLYFGFTGNKSTTPLAPGERLYIMYDKYLNPPQYLFSPDNKKTALWIEAEQRGTQATIKVSMVDDEGDLIRTPRSYAEFALAEKEFAKGNNNTWELGKWRVDATLLARQKTRWFGVDKFIDTHGGDEYKNWINKQRLDFGEADDVYSVYIADHQCMIWKDNHWQVATPGQETINYPILCVKRIDDRVMNLELWDVGGKGKVMLNLVKSSEQWMPKNIEDNFHFVGARTRSQYIFEIENERTTLRPNDWLVLTDTGWKKLITPQEIDDYVNRKVTGPLFVFNGVETHDGKQSISGTLYSAARTEMVPVELQLQQTSGATSATMTAKKGKIEKNNKIKETNPHSMVKVRERAINHPRPAQVPEEDDTQVEHDDESGD